MVDDLSAGPPSFRYKQVIVMRNDLKMSRGKIAAQAGHAAISAAEEARKKFSGWWKAWIEEGQCKIAVRAESEQELLELEKKAKNSKLPTALIIDRGLTELPPDTITCLGIGPAPSAQVDAITGKLPLL
jgi:PTH2 family peptidyl-tRNA hydrolase